MPKKENDIINVSPQKKREMDAINAIRKAAGPTALAEINQLAAKHPEPQVEQPALANHESNRSVLAFDSSSRAMLDGEMSCNLRSGDVD